MGKKEIKNKDKDRVKRVLRCSICFSDRNDFYLGGNISLQMYQCHDCGYIGPGFIEVEE